MDREGVGREGIGQWIEMDGERRDRAVDRDGVGKDRIGQWYRLQK